MDPGALIVKKNLNAQKGARGMTMDNRKEVQEIRAKRFETKAEAQEVADELNKCSMGEAFCPLIKEMCRTDCQCFVPANTGQILYSYQDKTPKWVVRGFYCDNAMFSGHTESHS
jgi:hypothetical protein